MEVRIESPLSLFLAGFVLVLLASFNVYQTAHGHVVQAGILSFVITLVWGHVIRSINQEGALKIVAYAAGSACGAMSGILLAQYVYL